MTDERERGSVEGVKKSIGSLKGAVRTRRWVDVSETARHLGFRTKVRVSHRVREVVLRMQPQCPCAGCENLAQDSARSILRHLLRSFRKVVEELEGDAGELEFAVTVPAWEERRVRRVIPVRASIGAAATGEETISITLATEPREVGLPQREGPLPQRRASTRPSEGGDPVAEG